MTKEVTEKWIRKPFDGTGVHINIKKRTILYNPKRSWIRFETSNLIHIYLHSETGSSKTGESNEKKGVK